MLALQLESQLRWVAPVACRAVHSLSVPVVQGDFKLLPPKVGAFVHENVELCKPRAVHICDGSEAELKAMQDLMQREGTIKPLPKYENRCEFLYF